MPRDIYLEMMQEAHNLKASWESVLQPLVQAEGLTPLQLVLLLGVAERRISNINGVCHELDMGQGNASTLCKRLEADGFLTRTRSRDDERIVLLTLTERGRAAVARVGSRLAAYSKSMTQRFPEKMEAILSGLRIANELLRLLAAEQAALPDSGETRTDAKKENAC